MLRRITTRITLLLLCLSGWAQAADGWAQLKLGLTPEETLTALGRPLMRTSGNGFEVWLYDERSEVVFFGTLIGWTKPGSANQAGLINDVWLSNHSDKPSATFLAQLPTPVIKPARPRAENTNVWLPAYGFRH